MGTEALSTSGVSSRKNSSCLIESFATPSVSPTSTDHTCLFSWENVYYKKKSIVFTI